MNLFPERYKNGDTYSKIFASCGYDIAILGENRVYGFPRCAMRLMGTGPGFTGTAEKNRETNGPQDTDQDTMLTRQSISDMQRELEYLRLQVQLLKKPQRQKAWKGSARLIYTE